MIVELDAEQISLRDNIRRYMTRHVDPVIAQHERDKTFPFELFRELRQFGYIGGLLKEEDGGLGLDYITWASMMEEAGYHWLSMRVLLNSMNIVAQLIAQHGTAAQKERFLQPILRGEGRVFIAISEPNTGSNIAGMEARAELKGEHYVLSGRKLWITNGMFADFGIVVAKTYSDECQGGLSLFLVEHAQTPFERRPIDLMMLQSNGTAELGFNELKLPRENLLGREGEGLKQTLTGLNFGRLNVSMGAVGAAQAALDRSIDYAKQRKQFNRPIGSFQLVQKHIVDMTIRTEAARALAYRAAAAMQKGLDSRQECSIAKLYATEAAHEVASMALQVHGSMGYSRDLPIERIFRDTRGGIIPEGTTEIQTLIIGREILGISAIA